MELTQDNPSPFSFLGVEGRESEYISENRRVQHFDADVAVQETCDGARNPGDRITEGLEPITGNACVGSTAGQRLCIRRLTLIRRVECELTLCGIDHHSAHQVSHEDKNLGDDEPFPEIVPNTY
jgi:hypothetical protein